MSTSTVGRILKNLMRRGRIMSVPTLRRKPGGGRFRLISKRYAKRLPKGLKPTRPGQLVQIDTVFVSLAPGKAVKHFTAYDPVAKWTVAGVAGRATANLAAGFLDQVLVGMPVAPRRIHPTGICSDRVAIWIDRRGHVGISIRSPSIGTLDNGKPGQPSPKTFDPCNGFQRAL